MTGNLSRLPRPVSLVAVVGDKKWEQWASKVSRFFTGSDVRFFDHEQADEAREWICTGW